jgi:hypothetical protein
VASDCALHSLHCSIYLSIWIRLVDFVHLCNACSH